MAKFIAHGKQYIEYLTNSSSLNSSHHRVLTFLLMLEKFMTPAARPMMTSNDSLHDHEKDVDADGADTIVNAPVTVKSENPPSNEEVTYPEGGYQAWMTVFGIWLIQFATFGYTNAYGVFNDYYVRVYMEGKFSSSTVSWIGSTQLWLVMSSGIVSGRLYDMGYFFHLIIGGSILFVFCLFMLSLAQPGQFYQVFLAQGIGAGLGIGMIYVPGIAVVSQYFYKRRTLAMATVASGSGVGAALQSIMLNKLFERLGFQTTLRISAAFNAGILCIGIFISKMRFAPIPPKNSNLLRSMRIFFREPEYIAVVAGTFFNLMALFFPTFFLQLNANQKGIMTENLSFYLLPVLNAATVIGRIVFPLMVPVLGIFNVVIPCVIICAILIFCELAVASASGSFILAVLYGVFYGAYVGMFAPMVGSLAKTDSEIGARMGICFAFNSFGGLIGTPIAGALLTSSYKWWRPTLFAGLSALLGAACLIASRFWISRYKGSQKV
ncbi:major facilitator superfamily domain-containing protein [Rhodocollybia butyracea]|uniref:Major facilitator superfamily domain-containing protein n=1 Tax=Rhodocollybia butyracea TaxID=206335 RepID=A0A9P5PVU4_9AGAR|nr:major facilitator superfamily domain-containing protein [Rhodocollybia butyracea]